MLGDDDENYANVSILLNLQQSVYKDYGSLVNKSRVQMPQIRDLLGKIKPSETNDGDGERGQSGRTR
jgi:hypothetical protein